MISIQTKSLIGFFWLLLLAASVQARDFSVERVNANYLIEPNGLVTASEYLTIHYSGEYDSAYRYFPKGNGIAEDVQLWDSGQQLAMEKTTDENGDKYTWRFSAKDETKEFHLVYSITNAIQSYLDVAEFRWKFGGSAWEKPIGIFYADVRFPKPLQENESYYALQDPDIVQFVQLSQQQTASIQSNQVPVGSFKQIGFAFPSNQLVSQSQYIQSINENGLEKIKRSYRATNYTVEKKQASYVIEPSGLVLVEDRLTYGFDGFFPSSSRRFIKRYWEVKNVSGRMEGKPLVLKVNDQTDFTEYAWDHNTTDAKRTFEFTYEIDGLIKKYNDWSIFEWEVGSDQSKPLGELYAIVRLPKPVKPTEAYISTYVQSYSELGGKEIDGNPIQSGKASWLDDQTIEFHVYDVPPQQYFGMRVDFNSALLDSNDHATIIQGNLIEQKENATQPTYDENANQKTMESIEKATKAVEELVGWVTTAALIFAGALIAGIALLWYFSRKEPPAYPTSYKPETIENPQKPKTV